MKCFFQHLKNHEVTKCCGSSRDSPKQPQNHKNMGKKKKKKTTHKKNMGKKTKKKNNGKILTT